MWPHLPSVLFLDFLLLCLSWFLRLRRHPSQYLMFSNHWTFIIQVWDPIRRSAWQPTNPRIRFSFGKTNVYISSRISHLEGIRHTKRLGLTIFSYSCALDILQALPWNLVKNLLSSDFRCLIPEVSFPAWPKRLTSSLSIVYSTFSRLHCSIVLRVIDSYIDYLQEAVLKTYAPTMWI